MFNDMKHRAASLRQLNFLSRLRIAMAEGFRFYETNFLTVDHRETNTLVKGKGVPYPYPRRSVVGMLISLTYT